MWKVSRNFTIIYQPEDRIMTFVVNVYISFLVVFLTCTGLLLLIHLVVTLFIELTGTPIYLLCKTSKHVNFVSLIVYMS